MIRRFMKLVLSCFVMVGICGSVVRVQAEGEKRWNILVIMADDLGWMDLHCQGNEKLDTPNLDKFAREGVRFTRGYAASPVCTPTRAAMMTGQAPARLGITNHAPGNITHKGKDGKLQGAEWTTYLSLEHETIAERLKAAGYATGFLGKWHLSHRKREGVRGGNDKALRPEHQGFEMNVGGVSYGGPPTYWDPYRIDNIPPRKKGEYLPERLTDEALGFMKAHKDGPFFLSLWNYAVHYPWEAPEDLVKKYKGTKGPGIKNEVFAAQIEAMDRALGRLLKGVDELGLRENTLVIFKSDNGSWDGDNRPLRGAKGHIYEGGLRVPFMVRWPGVTKAGRVCDVPVVSTDVYPTLLEVAGLKPRAGRVLDGVSLVPLLKGAEELGREALYFHYPNYAFHKQNRLGSAIVMGDYKLIKFYDGGASELYDLSKDIGEKRNIAGVEAERAKVMQAKLEGWLEGVGAKYPRVVE